jgi:Double zinc ribbon
LTDLERFFVQLVRNVAAEDSTRLQKPLLLVDIRNSILPYRANRRALRLESSEDYEWVLLRLCAGEGGFARTGPDDVADDFRNEVGTPNPDLTVVQRHENAVVHLDPRAVAKALDPDPELVYAPRAPASQSGTQPAAASKGKRPVREPRPATPQRGKASDTGSRCSRCGITLPAGRVVNFCPGCGQNLSRRRCASCQTELEPTWRHCVNCGATVAAN